MHRQSNLSLRGSEGGKWGPWASGKDKLSQLHSPCTPDPSTPVSHFSAQELKLEALGSSAWFLVHAPALTRNMSWTEVSKTQFLYLQNDDNNRTCVIELFERLKIIYKVLSPLPGT